MCSSCQAEQDLACELLNFRQFGARLANLRCQAHLATCGPCKQARLEQELALFIALLTCIKWLSHQICLCQCIQCGAPDRSNKFVCCNKFAESKPNCTSRPECV